VRGERGVGQRVQGRRERNQSDDRTGPEGEAGLARGKSPADGRQR